MRRKTRLTNAILSGVGRGPGRSNNQQGNTATVARAKCRSRWQELASAATMPGTDVIVR